MEDLTGWVDANPDVKAKLFPSSFAAATVDGKIYAVPTQTVAPIVFYYNKELFAKANAQPPKTWDDLIAVDGQPYPALRVDVALSDLHADLQRGAVKACRSQTTSFESCVIRA